MGFVVRVVRLILSVAVGIVWWSLSRLYHLSLILLIRVLLPFLLAVLRIAGSLVFASLTAAAIGPRLFIERLSSQWTRWLLDQGVSREYLDQLYTICRIMAVSQIALGWIITTLFTVAILRVVFGFLN